MGRCVFDPFVVGELNFTAQAVLKLSFLSYNEVSTATLAREHVDGWTPQASMHVPLFHRIENPQTSTSL